MELVGQETCPLPEDPALGDVAVALRHTGHWGWVVDHPWRLVYMTDETRLTAGGGVGLAPVPLGVHLFGPGYKSLEEGAKVEYEQEVGPKGPNAANVRTI